MLLKGVTMINHLKSKILITGRNFCYLRSPLVARKKKKKIITGYSPPKVEWSREGRGGGAQLLLWIGGGQESHPCKRPSQRQARQKVKSTETWGWPARQRLEFHLWAPLEASSVRRLVGSTPPSLPLTPGGLFRMLG